jgi:integrase
MARRSNGGIVERQTRRGVSFSVRFRAFGKRQFVHVGHAADGVTRADAERELGYIVEQVRRGEWQPPAEAAPPPAPVPTFHEAASAWFEARRTEGGKRGSGLSQSGAADLRWRLEVHLLPAFASNRLDAITVQDVDTFRRRKVAEGRIGATSINKCLSTLSAILEEALEYGHVERNVAAGKRRRLPSVKPPRTYLDRADHIAALLDAGGVLDRERDGRTRPYRRALLAVLVLAGLRIDEALSLRWRYVDLAAGRLRVVAGKTDAAARVVPLLPALRDELLAVAARRRDTDPSALVFPTRTGGKLSATNVRRRVLAPAVTVANAALAERDLEPLPDGLTPHSLRRTCASILVALGWDPARVMRTLGHTTAAFTLSVYARSMDWTEGEPERLRALVEGREWAPMGTSAADARIEAIAPAAVASEGSAL